MTWSNLKTVGAALFVLALLGSAVNASAQTRYNPPPGGTPGFVPNSSGNGAGENPDFVQDATALQACLTGLQAKFPEKGIGILDLWKADGYQCKSERRSRSDVTSKTDFLEKIPATRTLP